MPRSNDDALAALIARLDELRALAEALRQRADDHLAIAPDEVHWGHVGSVGFAVERLKEAATTSAPEVFPASTPLPAALCPAARLRGAGSVS